LIRNEVITAGLHQAVELRLTDGSAKENRAPPSGLLSARSSPPCSRTMP